MLTIGKVAKLAEVSVDALRFYEKESLLIPSQKSPAGYRLYQEDAVRRIRFIKHAQHCGFTIAEIRELLQLKMSDATCCNDICHFALEKKLQLEHRIKAMRIMSDALSELITTCSADSRPSDECPILNALENG